MKASVLRIFELCLIPPPYGGITSYVARLSEKLMGEGHIIGGYYTKECTNFKFISSSNFHQLNYSSNTNILTKILKKSNRIINHLINSRGFEIIHYHGLENLSIIYFMHRYLRKKIVITVHSTMIESFFKRTSHMNQKCLRKLAESDAQWIAVSEQAKKCMLNLPFKFKKDILIIPAYVPIKRDQNIPLSKELTEYLNSHKQNIGFYARSFMINDGADVYGFTNAIKLYADLIKIKEFDNVGLIFCLSEIDDCDKIKSIRQFAKSLNVDDKIFWQLGALDNIIELWRRIDLYIRPTSTDGDSVAVREVIDEGAQIVASDVCPRPDEVITYKYSDAEDFLNKVIGALSRGRKAPKSNYTYYEMIKTVYESL